MSYRHFLPVIAIFLTSGTVPCALLKKLGPIPKPGVSIDENRGQASPDTLFVVAGTQASLAIQRNAVHYAPYNYALSFVGANPSAAATVSKPLPGLASYYSSSDPATPARSINRYSEVSFHGVYPGVNATYAVSGNDVVLRLQCAAVSSLAEVVLEVPYAISLDIDTEGKLHARFPQGDKDMNFEYTQPLLRTDELFYTSPPSAGYRILAPNRFAIDLSGQTVFSSIEVEIKLTSAIGWGGGDYAVTDDSEGTYIVRTFSDFPASDASSAGSARDLAVFKFLASGELAYVTYLHGSYDRPFWLPKLSTSGKLLLSGLAGGDAIQGWSTYALYLDTVSGKLLASTVYGTGARYSFPAPVIGVDDSVYILTDDTGTDGFYDAVVHLDSTLSRVMYRTRLPGQAIATAIRPDGSFYFGGSSNLERGAVPMVGRLSPSGDLQQPWNSLTPDLRGLVTALAVAPDGRVWVGASLESTPASFDNRLLCLNAALDKTLFATPAWTTALQMDRADNVLATTLGTATVSENALVGGPCGSALSRIDPDGKALFSTYLPPGLTLIAPADDERLILSDGSTRFELDQHGDAVPFIGCAANNASHLGQNVVAPGEIISIYGSMLGAEVSAAASFSSGHLPDALGDTQVLLNGIPIPLLYVSSTRIDAVIPSNTPAGSAPLLQVMTSKGLTPPITVNAAESDIGIFTADGSGSGQAAALNEDGTRNSPHHPAKPGSVVTLFGTGGGMNETPLEAGTIAPSKPNPLTARRVSATVAGGQQMNVEYIGSAPGQPAGVVQVNVRLPEVIYSFGLQPRSATPIGISIAVPVAFQLTTIAVE